MKNIIFIAPPAAGKGTLSNLLVENYNYEHISTGDLLRREAASGSELGLEIGEALKTGKLISSEIVNTLLTNTLASSTKPFILDGYPRNMEQVPYLEEILEKVNKSIDLVIYLDVNYDILLKRAIGRLNCSGCSQVYNKYFMKPKLEDLCDVCGSKLVSRTDDNEETFKVRYDTYLESTKPLVEYYENKGILVRIEKTSSAEETFEEVRKYIK